MNTTLGIAGCVRKGSYDEALRRTIRHRASRELAESSPVSRLRSARGNGGARPAPRSRSGRTSIIVIVDMGQTTAAIQRYLDDLGGVSPSSPAETIVRDLLSEAAQRLHVLCAALLHRSYGRLAAPPLNLRSDEMLGAVVDRMLTALRQVRPQ